MPGCAFPRNHKFVFALLATLFSLACGSDPAVSIDAGTPDSAQCSAGDVRPRQFIYFGTALPQYVMLTPGQIIAIGMAGGGCSATLITPTWVLTAGHCGITTNDRFCIGAQANNPNVCFTTVRVVNNPNVDMTLMELDQDARNLLPAVEPIPIMVETMGQAYVGQTAEIAGYGDQEDNTFGVREFSAETITATNSTFVTVDGMGLRGACFGDSGGPLMVVAGDATVRVAGDLSNGDGTCVDQDNYARVDPQAAWIESFTGPTPGGDGSCGAITSVGRCFSQGALAAWCGQNNLLASEQCMSGTACGWDDIEQGFRCIVGADPCGGVDEFGSCDGNIARWCESGQPRMRDCRACGSTDLCAATAITGVGCVADPCMGLDYLGRCNGNVAEWCDGGQLQSRDCSADGTTCQYIDNQIGYYCQ